MQAPGGNNVQQNQRHYEFISPTPNEGEVIPAEYSTLFPHGQYTLGPGFGASFVVKARIFGPGRNSVRYKQYVRGAYTYNGVSQPHIVSGVNLSPDIWEEDKNGNGSYGDRSIQNSDCYSYKPKSMDGGGSYDLFLMNDTPSDLLHCAVGTVVRINLEFMGVLCNPGSGEVYVTRRWHVRGQHTKR